MTAFWVKSSKTPLSQAGANKPFSILAQLDNLGNLPIPAGSVNLRVTLDHPGTDVNPQATIKAQKLSTGLPLSGPRGLVIDPDGNFYTVNSTYGDNRIIRIDPQGRQSVFATVPGGAGLSALALESASKPSPRSTSTASARPEKAERPWWFCAQPPQHARLPVSSHLCNARKYFPHLKNIENIKEYGRRQHGKAWACRKPA